ncbi:unnamed protein product [Discosporangium mesarthrocarpum]
MGIKCPFLGFVLPPSGGLQAFIAGCPKCTVVRPGADYMCSVVVYLIYAILFGTCNREVQPREGSPNTPYGYAHPTLLMVMPTQHSLRLCPPNTPYGYAHPQLERRAQPPQPLPPTSCGQLNFCLSL